MKRLSHADFEVTAPQHKGEVIQGDALGSFV